MRHATDAEEEKGNHWEDANELLNKTCRSHLILWGSDANGKLGHRNQDEEERYAKKEHADQRIIEPYAKAIRTEKGNGAQLHRICRRQHMIPMTAWMEPKIEGEDKWEQQPAEATRGNWERNFRKNIPQPGPVRMET